MSWQTTAKMSATAVAEHPRPLTTKEAKRAREAGWHSKEECIFEGSKAQFEAIRRRNKKIADLERQLAEVRNSTMKEAQTRFQSLLNECAEDVVWINGSMTAYDGLGIIAKEMGCEYVEVTVDAKGEREQKPDIGRGAHSRPNSPTNSAAAEPTDDEAKIKWGELCRNFPKKTTWEMQGMIARYFYNLGKKAQPPPPKQAEAWTEEDVEKVAKWYAMSGYTASLSILPKEKQIPKPMDEIWLTFPIEIQAGYKRIALKLLSSLRPSEHLICPTCNERVCKDIDHHKQPQQSEDYDEQLCKKGHAQTWQECETCGGEGMTDEHDCGEDTCACLNPEPNVECDICDGEGGRWWCETCYREKLKKEKATHQPRKEGNGKHKNDFKPEGF